MYNEIQKLCEIKGLDQNLVEYAFVHLQKISVSPDQILIQLNVAQKIFSSEENMQDTYELIVQKSNLLRLLAAQAICGLRYLHEASMTHKHLTLGSVWTRNSTGDCVFRFSDFGSMGPLLDLVKMFGDICSGKYVARDEDKEKEYDRRRKDLFQLGTLLDGLILAVSFQSFEFLNKISNKLISFRLVDLPTLEFQLQSKVIRTLVRTSSATLSQNARKRKILINSLKIHF